MREFKHIYDAQEYDKAFYGVIAHQNNGDANGTTTTCFEPGHTYYSAFALLDGPITFPPAENKYDIYRFTWHGPETDLNFTHEDCTHGAW